MKSNLSIFSPLNCALGFISKRPLASLRLQRFFFLIRSCKTFIRLGFTSRSMIHFKIIFVHVARQRSAFTSLQIDSQVCWYHLSKIAFVLLWKIGWAQSFLHSLCCANEPFVYIYANITLSWLPYLFKSWK